MSAARANYDKARSAHVARQTSSAAGAKTLRGRERFLHIEEPGVRDIRRSKHRAHVESQEEGQYAYKPEYAHIAKTMCSGGSTNADLAKAFQVSLATIAAWRSDNEQFSCACKLGEEIADARVERSIFARAVGYDYREEKFIHQNGKTQVIEQVVHVQADVNAARFWLTNRRPERWADKPRSGSLSHSDQGLRELAEQLKGTALRPKE